MARPEKYPNGFGEKEYTIIEAASGMGLTVAQIASLLGLGKTAFYEYAKGDSEIIERLRSGKAKIAFEVGKALVNRAKGGDVAAIRWYEMTRLNRAEKSESTVTEKQYVVTAPPKPESKGEWEKNAESVRNEAAKAGK